jgi:hypothetical protein
MHMHMRSLLSSVLSAVAVVRARGSVVLVFVYSSSNKTKPQPPRLPCTTCTATSHKEDGKKQKQMDQWQRSPDERGTTDHSGVRT